MSLGQAASDTLELLLVSSFALSLTGCVALAASRALARSRPWVAEAVWALVLVQGVLLIRATVELPLLGSQTVTDTESLPSTSRPTSSPTAGLERLTTTRASTARLRGRSDYWSRFSSKCAGPHAAALWCIGAVAFVGVRLRQCARFQAEISECQPAPAFEQLEWEAVAQEMGLRSPAPMLFSTTRGPLVCWTPSGSRLVVPAKLWQSLESDQRHLVLRHESAHLLRGDLMRGMFAEIVLCLHWFNPLAWVARRRFRESVEWSCDSLATGKSQSAAISLARALLRCLHTGGTTTAAAAGIGTHPVGRRIHRLLLKPSETSQRTAVVTAIGLCLFAAASCEFRLVPAGSPHQSAGGVAKDGPLEVDTPSMIGAAMARRLDPGGAHADLIGAYLTSDAWSRDVHEAFDHSIANSLEDTIRQFVEQHDSAAELHAKISGVSALTKELERVDWIEVSVSDGFRRLCGDRDFLAFLACQYATTAGNPLGLETPLMTHLRGGETNSVRAEAVAEEIRWLRGVWPKAENRGGRIRAALIGLRANWIAPDLLAALSEPPGVAFLADSIDQPVTAGELASSILNGVLRETEGGLLRVDPLAATEWTDAVKESMNQYATGNTSY